MAAGWRSCGGVRPPTGRRAPRQQEATRGPAAGRAAEGMGEEGEMEVVVEKEVVMVVVAARHLRTRHAERRRIERFDRLRGERLVQGAARVGVCGELRARGVDERRHRAAERRERRRRQRRLARRRLVGLVEAREEVGRLRADDAADAAVERREEEEAEQLDDGGHRRERRRVREERGGGGGLVDDEADEVLEGLRCRRLPRRRRVVREEEAGEPVEGGRNGVSEGLCACVRRHVRDASHRTAAGSPCPRGGGGGAAPPCRRSCASASP